VADKPEGGPDPWSQVSGHGSVLYLTLTALLGLLYLFPIVANVGG
jgi:hypothetical protein